MTGTIIIMSIIITMITIAEWLHTNEHLNIVFRFVDSRVGCMMMMLMKKMKISDDC